MLNSEATQRPYVDGYKPLENEYLLKIRIDDNTGFMSKLTMKNALHKSFEEWGIYKYSREPQVPLPIYVIEETYRSGWELISWRIGQSQEWATVLHPFGFTVEIYLTDFLNIVKNNVIVNGKIEGEFKWEGNKLIKK